DDGAHGMAGYYRDARERPERNQCAHCGHPGYVHSEFYSPPSGLLAFTALPVSERARPVTFLARDPDEAAAYIAARPMEYKSVAEVPLPSPRVWTAVGTENPVALNAPCPGFEPEP